MSSLVSVIIPAYNAEMYIKNCLQSVIEQTYQNIEIICVDDGSQDNSREIICNLAEKCDKIKYIFQQNAGVSAARNNGLSVAKGDFIVFLDSDDYIHPQAIELLLDCESKTHADIVFCECKTTNKTNEETSFINSYSYSYPDFDFLFNGTDQLGRCVWGKLIKSELALKYKFPVGLNFGEDTYYMVSMLKNNLKIVLINESLWFYYSNPTSLSHGVSIESEIQMLSSFDILFTELEKSDCDFLKGYVLKSIYRSFFTIRSYFANINGNKEILTKNKKYARKWFKTLCFCNYVKPKNKIAYIAFYCSRLIYEKAFIMHDPTMKDYYKRLRKNK